MIMQNIALCATGTPSPFLSPPALPRSPSLRSSADATMARAPSTAAVPHRISSSGPPPTLARHKSGPRTQGRGTTTASKPRTIARAHTQSRPPSSVATGPQRRTASGATEGSGTEKVARPSATVSEQSLTKEASDVPHRSEPSPAEVPTEAGAVPHQEQSQRQERVSGDATCNVATPESAPRRHGGIVRAAPAPSLAAHTTTPETLQPMTPTRSLSAAGDATAPLPAPSDSDIVPIDEPRTPPGTGSPHVDSFSPVRMAAAAAIARIESQLTNHAQSPDSSPELDSSLMEAILDQERQRP